MPTSVLIVGGAGFIGSQMALLLQDRGLTTLTFDNLQTGRREAVFGPFVEGDLRDQESLNQLFSAHRFDAVLHFAASTAVGESVIRPHEYHANNVIGTLHLIQAMLHHGVNKLIFSSTAAVYGEGVPTPIVETSPKKPCNPYGRTKWVVEQLLEDYQPLGLSSVVFRYFNAAGCDPQQRTGERRHPVSHLIPIVLEVAQQKRARFELLGDDYPTRDGSCVRDFVHVMDLCEAHLLGLEYIMDKGQSAVYNLGSEQGHSVLEVWEMAQRITQKSIPLIRQPRRPGDCGMLVADSSKAKRELNWRPKRSTLDLIIQDTWNWMERH